ncbi:MAG: hypothetical protein SFV51_27930 [Bryobacteraceae bacterium]|nr:hypothetical protein [Bryobacteraceae bacterium]
MNRRGFLTATLAAGMPAQIAKTRFFTVAQRRSHWFFVSPSGEPVFSIGLNHVDSATLRFASSGGVWRDRFGNSEERFIKEGVRKDLLAWGFNCLGWNQEVVIRGETLTEGGILHRHSRSWTPEEYRWLGLPYCHLLPFIESHQWEYESRLPDLRSREFEEWCDYVARTDCARMADDPNLIGYFYTDCPIWVHTRRPAAKPPIFDPALLKTDAGRKELFDLATHYYRTLHSAIRRYDPNHLILGDRYEARALLAEPVLRAAVPYIDVLSFQDFGPITEVAANFQRWHEITGKPVLLADASARQKDAPRLQPYALKIRTLRELDCCVGFHLCGAYLKNTARARGLRNERFEPDQPFIGEIVTANRETAAFVRTY